MEARKNTTLECPGGVKAPLPIKVNTMSRQILVVDDYSNVRTLLRVMLEAEGYKVLEAKDGQEAVALATERRPDLVILDLMMPAKDGELVIGDIRSALGKGAEMPILVLTAKQDAVERVKDLLGEDRVMTKPFEPSELLARVKELAG